MHLTGWKRAEQRCRISMCPLVFPCCLASSPCETIMFLCALSALPESVHSTRIRTWRTDRDRLLALPHHPSSAPERAADHVCHHINSVDKGLTVFIVNHYQLRDCAAAEVLARSECHLAAESPPARSLTTAPSPPAPAPPSSSALPPTRLPATTLAMPWAASQPAPVLSQSLPAASNAALAPAPSTTALAPPYAASSAALAPAPPPMASDAAHTRPGTAAFSATPCATSTSLTWWVKAAACLLITLAALLLTPPPVAPPEAQDLSTSWLRADYYGPCHTHSPSAGALPGASRAPLPKVGVALPDAMCRSRAPAGRFPCSRRARAARAAPPLPPVPRGSLEPLHCRAEAARVLVQEPRSPRVVSTGMIPCTRSSMPIDDGRVQVCWLMVTGAAAQATSTSIAYAALHNEYNSSGRVRLRDGGTLRRR